MYLFAATVFLSAFLLFLVQPILAKQILPWFGGTAAVWTTCLVFFQTLLLAGYAYCDLVIPRASPRTQVRLHTALLALSLVFLPIIAGAQWKPTGAENPSILISAVPTLDGTSTGFAWSMLSSTSYDLRGDVNGQRDR